MDCLLCLFLLQFATQLVRLGFPKVCVMHGGIECIRPTGILAISSPELVWFVIHTEALSLHFISSIPIVKPRTLRKVNLITVQQRTREDNERSFSFRFGRKTPNHCANQKTYGEKSRREFLFKVWEENPKDLAKKKPTQSVGTENPIH